MCKYKDPFFSYLNQTVYVGYVLFLWFVRLFGGVIEKVGGMRDVNLIVAVWKKVSTAFNSTMKKSPSN